MPNIDCIHFFWEKFLSFLCILNTHTHFRYFHWQFIARYACAMEVFVVDRRGLVLNYNCAWEAWERQCRRSVVSSLPSFCINGWSFLSKDGIACILIVSIWGRCCYISAWCGGKSSPLTCLWRQHRNQLFLWQSQCLVKHPLYTMQWLL